MGVRAHVNCLLSVQADTGTHPTCHPRPRTLPSPQFSSIPLPPGPNQATSAHPNPLHVSQSLCGLGNTAQSPEGEATVPQHVSHKGLCHHVTGIPAPCAVQHLACAPRKHEHKAGQAARGDVSSQGTKVKHAAAWPHKRYQRCLPKGAWWCCAAKIPSCGSDVAGHQGGKQQARLAAPLECQNTCHSPVCAHSNPSQMNPAPDLHSGDCVGRIFPSKHNNKSNLIRDEL